MMIAFSAVSTFQVRLPAGDDQTSSLHLIIRIRDLLECVTELNLTTIYVLPDSAGMNDLVNSLQSSSTNTATTSNPIARLLSSRNQNTVGQVISSISQQLNKKNNQSMNNVISSKLYPKIRLDFLDKMKMNDCCRWCTSW